MSWLTLGDKGRVGNLGPVSQAQCLKANTFNLPFQASSPKRGPH